MAAWHEIIIALRDQLRGQANLNGALVEAGALDPEGLDLAKKYPDGALLLIRDREGSESPFRGGEGEVEFFAEAWIRDDNKDPAVGYGKLASLEDKFIQGLVDLANAGIPTVDLVDVTIDDTIGDQDSRRPLLGSRKTIRVKWSKRTL